jgi:anti-sigma regulatory factor (Ser/Thr protein kinase)
VVDEVRVRLEAEAHRLAEVRRVIRDWLQSHHVARPDDVVLAVDEAVANAIEHAGPVQRERAFIDVVARSDGRSIHVDVIDGGSWRPRRDDAMRGRGLDIIEALMDDVRIEGTSTGTRVTMHRSIWV